MEPSPGLALPCVVVISDLVVAQEREIELDTADKKDSRYAWCLFTEISTIVKWNPPGGRLKYQKII